MRHRVVPCLGAAVVALLLASAARAQTPRYSLTGRLLDKATGTPIHSGVVQLSTSNRRVLSDSLGRFAFPDLPAGRYSLVASALGYRETAAFASTDEPVLVLVTPEPIPLSAIVALATSREARVRGAKLKVFGRTELLAAGDMPVAQFVNWRAHFMTRPCHVAVTDTEVPPGWEGLDCIIGPMQGVAPVMVMVDGQPLRYSSELWAHMTWDLGRVEVLYDRATGAFHRPMAFIRLYSLPYLARTAAQASHLCDHISTADTIGDRYLASLCRQ